MESNQKQTSQLIGSIATLSSKMAESGVTERERAAEREKLREEQFAKSGDAIAEKVASAVAAAIGEKLERAVSLGIQSGAPSVVGGTSSVPGSAARSHSGVLADTSAILPSSSDGSGPESNPTTPKLTAAEAALREKEAVDASWRAEMERRAAENKRFEQDVQHLCKQVVMESSSRDQAKKALTMLFLVLENLRKHEKLDKYRKVGASYRFVSYRGNTVVHNCGDLRLHCRRHIHTHTHTHTGQHNLQPVQGAFRRQAFGDRDPACDRIPTRGGAQLQFEERVGLLRVAQR